MLRKKARGRHSNFGTIYFLSLSGLFVTMAILSLLRWAENYHLFLLGVLAFMSAWFGRDPPALAEVAEASSHRYGHVLYIHAHRVLRG
jgi:hypothetical protein